MARRCVPPPAPSRIAPKAKKCSFTIFVKGDCGPEMIKVNGFSFGEIGYHKTIDGTWSVTAIPWGTCAVRHIQTRRRAHSLAQYLQEHGMLERLCSLHLQILDEAKKACDATRVECE